MRLLMNKVHANRGEHLSHRAIERSDYGITDGLDVYAHLCYLRLTTATHGCHDPDENEGVST